MKLIFGLGNPGKKYRETRHNLGFDVLAELVRRVCNASGSGVTVQSKFHAEVAQVQLAGEKVLLVSPLTFMNRSGTSAAEAMQFYKLEASQLLVVCDDINLDLGAIRCRASGSDGGQKGLRDIIEKLGTKEVPRLRLGIGQPPGRVDAADYVLTKFLKKEKEERDLMVVRAADAVECWLQDGVVETMNKFN